MSRCFRTAGTRRFLYRATLGWLRSPDNIIKSSEGKVDGLRVKMSDYSNEAKKLEVSTGTTHVSFCASGTGRCQFAGWPPWCTVCP